MCGTCGRGRRPRHLDQVRSRGGIKTPLSALSPPCGCPLRARLFACALTVNGTCRAAARFVCLFHATQEKVEMLGPTARRNTSVVVFRNTTRPQVSGTDPPPGVQGARVWATAPVCGPQRPARMWATARPSTPIVRFGFVVWFCFIVRFCFICSVLFYFSVLGA